MLIEPQIKIWKKSIQLPKKKSLKKVQLMKNKYNIIRLATLCIWHSLLSMNTLHFMENQNNPVS
jgi:hypothetical protein